MGIDSKEAVGGDCRARVQRPTVVGEGTSHGEFERAAERLAAGGSDVRGTA